jgi:hypothetical protein
VVRLLKRTLPGIIAGALMGGGVYLIFQRFLE